MKYRKHSCFSVYMGSIALAIWVSCQSLMQILYSYIGNGRGLFAPIISVASLFSLISIAANRRVKVNRPAIGLVVILMATFQLTRSLQAGKSSLETIDFIAMCILPIIFGSLLTVDYRLLFKISMWLLVLATPIYSQLFLKSNSSRIYDAVTMSMSYDILPIVTVGIIHMLFFGKNSTAVEKILYIISIVFALSFVRMSYRGALLALVVTVTMALYFRKRESRSQKQLKLLIIGVIVILLILNFSSVLVLVKSILDKFNIRIAFIDKTIYLLQYDTIAHGRLETYLLAIKGFLRSPVWGNGMATFTYYTGITFPHNFILQALFDGGLLLSVPLFFIYVLSFRRLFQYAKEEERSRFAYVLMLGSISVTRALLSAESWRIVLFWLFIGLCLNKEELPERVVNTDNALEFEMSL